MVFDLFKSRRRARLRARPVPAEWRASLEHNLPVFSRLSADDQAELLGHTQVFLAEKHFEGVGGLELTDEIRVTIAGQARLQARATGQAVDTVEWARTILSAFVQAGACALLSITILLWIVLRRFSDVMLTLIPLLVAAAVTLEICALSGFALNYANIIALPVLLGVGVAFKIYYVMEWRRGETNFLQSSLTRAVFFSALMTATAFGSLWLSRHPGMSSMGKLLALSLLCTLAAAALYQPALMGPPRKVESAGRARQLSSSPAE